MICKTYRLTWFYMSGALILKRVMQNGWKIWKKIGGKELWKKSLFLLDRNFSPKSMTIFLRNVWVMYDVT